MPASTAQLQPDERRQIATARGAILGVYLFALLICSCRVSVYLSAQIIYSHHSSSTSQLHVLRLAL